MNAKIVTRSRGGGTKKNYFCVDFVRRWSDKLAISLNLTKQSNRSAFISLLKYSNGTFSYVLASSSLIPGDFTFTTNKPTIFSIKISDMACNILLKYIDYTFLFFNIEVIKGEGGKYARAGGTFCYVVAFNLDKDIIKVSLPSGSFKYLSQYCLVTLGKASNTLNNKQFFVKAGYYRKLGFRPVVRGVAMNPVDHPHGGRTKTNSPELTPWGKIAKLNK